MILFVARADYANVGYNFAKALRSVGVKSMAVAVKKRETRTKMEQATIVSEGIARDMCKVSNCVVFMHSRRPWKGTSIAKVVKGKKVAVFHGGTYYRTRVREMNARWNPVVDLTMAQMPSMMGLGAKNEHWVIPAVDTEVLKPVYKVTDFSMLCVGHFPTGASKGTAIIVAGINKARLQGASLSYESSKGIVSWHKHLERMSKCDVIVDKVEQEIKGMRTGEWAVTTLEAAALGKVPVVTFNSEKAYQKLYGEHGIERVRNETTLTNKLITLAAMDSGMLIEKQKRARNWVERNHSLQATGRRLKEILR